MYHLKKAFVVVLEDYEHELVKCAGEKEEAVAKAKGILATLKAPEFFNNLFQCVKSSLKDVVRLTLCLSRIKEHLSPLAAATNTLQSDSCRLDTVAITLANLYRIFSNEKLDINIRRSVLRSLEKRWAKQDQDVFILAIIFNPWIRVSAFAQDSEYRQAGKVAELASAVYTRLFKVSPDLQFKFAIGAYIHRLECWSDERMGLNHYMPSGTNIVRAPFFGSVGFTENHTGEHRSR
jgi:hypothetical protein